MSADTRVAKLYVYAGGPPVLRDVPGSDAPPVHRAGRGAQRGLALPQLRLRSMRTCSHQHFRGPSSATGEV